MKDYSFFNCGGNWYKGNLHSHTTLTDGMLTPEQDVALYKAHGYSFLCISEHDLFTDFREEFNEPGFIILPGIEYSAGLFSEDGSRRYKLHHMHGILGTEEMQKKAENPMRHMEAIPQKKYYGTWDGAMVSQELCDMLSGRGCIVTYNHPVWSRVEESEFINTKGLFGLEIFNFNTVEESNTGFDTTYWDRMLRSGKKIWGFASDDNHNEGVFEDSCGGWVMVNAEELTHDNIILGLVNGNYYSSAGPEIYSYGIKEGIAYVECSLVEHVNFIAGNVIGDGITICGPKKENTLTRVEYKLKGHEDYLRMECVDKDGKAAYTNPIFIEY